MLEIQLSRRPSDILINANTMQLIATTKRLSRQLDNLGMERRHFLALAASVPLLSVPASADGDSESALSEQTSEKAAQSGTDTVEITVEFK